MIELNVIEQLVTGLCRSVMDVRLFLIERSWVRVEAGAAGNVLLQGALTVPTLTSVSVPPPCYRSST